MCQPISDASLACGMDEETAVWSSPTTTSTPPWREAPVVQRVAGAIHAGALAVPHGEHAIDLAVGAHAGLLRTHDGGGRHVFIDAGQEADLVVRQRLPGLPHGHVDAAQRRAAISGDEAGGVQAAVAVEPALRQHHAHQRLRAGQEHPPAGAGEVVAELIVEVDMRVDRGGAVHGVCSSSFDHDRCVEPGIHCVFGSCNPYNAKQIFRLRRKQEATRWTRPISAF
ncbi:Uncharacterised protein [Bordetella pertussis]|nr:hypothetical protein [Bordetella pertussis]CFL93239.1 Uncharacterised protein [Bordetella pertussis]CFM38586.1 Uncharacterised protein [Bordetella pertussis]CFM98657.1 Uncharacterised protein [Bordetella pertussis]CFN20428.1 Uncharacterised protein [Bordetella pertussis]CFN45158.1 Uncharacterised protein [Bordetella pertussis]